MHECSVAVLPLLLGGKWPEHCAAGAVTSWFASLSGKLQEWSLALLPTLALEWPQNGAWHGGERGFSAGGGALWTLHRSRALAGSATVNTFIKMNATHLFNFSVTYIVRTSFWPVKPSRSSRSLRPSRKSLKRSSMGCVPNWNKRMGCY